KAECCAAGHARIRPLPLPEAVNLSRGFEWWHSSQDKRIQWRDHPALDERQLRWEKEMENVSNVIREKVQDRDLTVHFFKSAMEVTSGEVKGYITGEDHYALDMLRSTSPAPIFLDIGANMGMVSILLAKKWPNARILAVEPAPTTFRYLLWNLRANDVLAQVWPLNLAVSTARRSVRMSHLSSGHVWTGQVPANASWTPSHVLKSDSVFDVSTASLPELLAGFGMGHQVDFLKLDCEGCEWEILSKWSFLQHLFQDVSVELHNGAFYNISLLIAEEDRIKLQEQVLKSELCQHRVTYFFGVKCRSYGEAGNLGAGVPSANHS
ncbi:unnamed protein product, partial [Durusdinium trenchii]